MYSIPKQKKYVLFVIGILVIFLDQVTKLYLINYLKQQPGYSVKINEYFNLVFVWNYGISFGILSYYSYSNYILLCLNLLLIKYLYKYLIAEKEYLVGALIIGGALGNIIDRIYHGGVFDFISLHYESYYFATFNVADMALSLGGFIFTIKRLYKIKT